MVPTKLTNMLSIGIPGGLEGAFLLFGLLPFILVVIALIDILSHEFEPQQNKLNGYW